MANGSIVAIYTAPKAGETMVAREEVQAEAGVGLDGDRKARTGNDPDREITLIEIEAIEALTRDHQVPFEISESRRNLVTTGVPLNHLVGRQFQVGPVTLEGLRLCEPCSHLESLTRPGVLKGLIHRGGLRARIVHGGSIRVGDEVQT